MQEPEEQQPRTGRVQVAGVRVFGRYVARSTVTLMVAIIFGIAGYALIGGGGADGGGLQIDAAADGPGGEEIPAGEGPETTTTSVTGADTTTSTVPSTTATSPSSDPTSKVTSPKPTTSTTVPAVTTTTGPAPTTCIVLRGSAATGTATTTWVASVNHPGTWDRHTTVTVKNPMAEPATLQGVWVQAANGYLERAFNGIGAPMAAGGTHTFEEISEGFADKGFTPVGVGGVEFIPSSAPDLFCIADPTGPPFLRDNYAHYRVDPEPNMYGTGSMASVPGGGIGTGVTFRTERPFPGLRVHFQVETAQGAEDRSAEFPRGRTEIQAFVTGTGPNGAVPRFLGMTKVEWDGGTRACTLGRDSC